VQQEGHVDGMLFSVVQLNHIEGTHVVYEAICGQE
jgi:hypothetical protein